MRTYSQLKRQMTAVLDGMTPEELALELIRHGALFGNPPKYRVEVMTYWDSAKRSDVKEFPDYKSAVDFITNINDMMASCEEFTREAKPVNFKIK